MRSLRFRFALLLGGTGLLAVLAAGGVLWSSALAEHTIDRNLAAQGRLELLADLSGRLTQYGLAAVETVTNADTPPEAMAVTRDAVDRALTVVEEALSRDLAVNNDSAGQVQYVARMRPLAALRAARAVLDRQVSLVQRQDEPDKRKDAIKGALNGFGAMTGQPLSLLIEAERRSIAAGTGEARDLSRRLRLVSLAAATAVLVIVALLYRLITRPTLARIEAVRQAAGAVGSGALDTRLAVAGRDELGLLVANFNRMAGRLARREGRLAADRAALEDTVAARTADLRAANERLEMVDRSRRRFFADVSHELRTPLTVILGECDIASRSASRSQGRSVDYTPVFATIRKRANGLKRRVEDLLRVARSESGQIELDRRPVSVGAVLMEAVDSASSEAQRRRIELRLDEGPRDFEALADREWLRQVVESLIDNALRHATGATRVVVSLEGLTSGAARIAVSDDGSGFPEGKGDLFERFRREAKPDATGFGIGLALARWVVESHDGAISLGAGRDGRGASVTLDLPVLHDSAEAERAGMERVDAV